MLPSVLRPTVLHVEDTFRMVQLGCVIVNVWLDAPTHEQMQVYATTARRLSAHHQGTYLLNVAIDGTPRFDARVRDEAARLTAEAVNARGTCHVVLVAGFRGAATRAFLSSLLLLQRTRSRTTVVADLPAAVQHACGCLGGGRPEADSRLLTRLLEWGVSRSEPWPPPWR